MKSQRLHELQNSLDKVQIEKMALEEKVRELSSYQNEVSSLKNEITKLQVI